MPGQGKIQVVVVDDTDDSREMILPNASVRPEH